MESKLEDRITLLDGSRIIIESAVAAGAEVFTGYPITPANLLYAYAGKRFPVFLPAPDEITALQWLCGFSSVGKVGVTATSFPGFALMLETLNMAYLMELPMVIILAQRLGPSTGSATAGAQGDLLLLRGCISGGYPIPVFCPADFKDCQELTHQAVKAAIQMRTPVILLTSKEMIMTNRSFDLNEFEEKEKVSLKYFENGKPYKPYLADEDTMVPPFLPLGNNQHQVRINSSTHDVNGFIQKATKEALDNTKRLKVKIEEGMKEFNFYSLNEIDEARILLVSYDISSDAVLEAAKVLKTRNVLVSTLILKTILPVPENILSILEYYEKVFIVEENLSGLLREILFGIQSQSNIYGINKIGEMISPEDIIAEVSSN